MKRRIGPFMALLLCACSGLAPTPPNPWPIDPAAITDPNLMVVDPTAAPAGEDVTLTFPGGLDRGVLFAIDASVGGEWERRAFMVSDANGGSPSWFIPGDPDAVVESVGIGGHGPDHIQVPEIMPAGPYRICTANAVENVCVPFEVVSS